MPMPVENLTEESTKKAKKDAIAASMEMCMHEGGRTMKECAGMVYGIAREKTGDPLEEGKIR